LDGKSWCAHVSVNNFIFITTLAASLFCATLLGQSVTPTIQPQTFHIHGMVRNTIDNSVVAGVKVTFEAEKGSKIVSTDRRGIYEADLPVGLYTMTVQPLSPDQLTYKRPLFRVVSSTNLVFDVTLDTYQKVTCEIVNPPPGNQISEPDRVKNTCGGMDLFLLPSEDGVAFQLLIRFGTRKPTENGYAYSAPVDFSVVPEPSYVYRSGRNPPTLGTPVFIAYNLFTLRADHVTYDEKNQTLHANGKVVVVNEKGETQRADSMNFRIENGEANPVP
jgi:hypothetical protein